VRRTLVSALVLMAGVAVATTNAAAGGVDYGSSLSSLMGSDALRAGPAVRKDSDSVR